ncbi:hypothetical protein EJ03DRAFT_347605 [Teratosphaeria nubilosa]|uniref:Uncharacterized protein n=1 Tax=Teratosphaeria nubilosa TaxID=161662 RepID=A0A6G1LL86_9PEZI|nr:hypothetical protein EJ03DRAFT_347605 [Teratosphaeria nubilosa]
MCASSKSYEDQALHRRRHHISLLFVDRITHAEALPIFFKASCIGLTQSQFLACAGTPSFKLTDTVYLCDLRLGESDDADDQMVQMLVSMPCLREVVVDYGPHPDEKELAGQQMSVRELFKLKRRLPSTKLGKTHSLAFKGMDGVYALGPTATTLPAEEKSTIHFINGHFYTTCLWLHSRFADEITEAEFIDKAGRGSTHEK